MIPTHTRQCVFCYQNVKEIDYRDVELLRRIMSSQAKIIDPRHTGVCAKHQRKVSRGVKRARIMGLLPFIRR